MNDIAALAETRFNLFQAVSFKNYSVTRYNRIGRGAALLIHNPLNYSILDFNFPNKFIQSEINVCGNIHLFQTLFISDLLCMWLT